MLDHVVYIARDLAAAVDDYRRQGFTVTPGGQHAGGVTHNALVCFADGSYLEIVGFRRPDPTHRWWTHATSGGFADFAVLSDDLAQDVSELKDLVVRDAAEGGRTRPDGVALRWRVAFLRAPLPFLIEDLTPRDLRVPAGDAARHANGVTGIASLVVAARDERSVDGSYERLRARGAPGIRIIQTQFDGLTDVGFAGMGGAS
ncbi:MAG: VOC family protein [Chloroflexota bacterium]|nr:VOC family protein [Chloroflexota bacterium]